MNVPLQKSAGKSELHIKRSLGCALCEVRDSSVCSVMHERDLPEVEQLMARRFLPAGQTIVTEGEPNELLFVLVKGSIRLVKQLDDGRRQVTGFLFPGDMLGVHPTRVSAYTAETLEDCHICRFSHRFLESAAERAPRVKDRLICRAQTEYHKAQDHIVLLGKKTAKERVQCFIEMIDNAIGQEIAGGRRHVPLPMPRRDIADYLGLRLETLSRTLGQLKKTGWLSEVSKHHMQLAPKGK